LSPKDRKAFIEDLRISESFVKQGLVDDFEAYMGT